MKRFPECTYAKSRGIATLVMAVILLLGLLLVSFFSANSAVLKLQTSRNFLQQNQAFQAAQAGLQYGLGYLQTNYSTIFASATGGVINYQLPQTSLNNNASFTVSISNPVANNFNLLNIQSTGTNADGTSTIVTNMQVTKTNSLRYALTTKGGLVLGAIMRVTGGVDMGGAISNNLTGLINLDGSSIITLNLSFSNMSNSSFFQNQIGITTTQQQANSTVYANANGINYASLSGNVWINAGVTSLLGGITVGTASNPVFLVINGDLNNLLSNTTINGILLVLGNINTQGTLTVNGALLNTGNLTVLNGQITYNQSIVDQLVPPNYTVVSGSWHDF